MNETILDRPLQINIEQDEDGWVVSDDVFLVYGYGDKIEDAINDYFISLADLYGILEIGAVSNQFDKKQLEYLKDQFPCMFSMQ